MALTGAARARRYRNTHTERYRKRHREWMREYRKKRAEFFKQYQREYRAKCNTRHNAYIESIKVACLHCGITDKRVLTFHHRNPKEKSFNIGDCAGHMWSLEKLQAEVSKCDILCSNCHLIVEDELRNKEKHA